MAPFLLALALLLLVAAFVLLRLSRENRAASGLPQGRVVYVDSRRWQRPPAPLRAPRYSLVGRPDFLMQEGKSIIPVESKPGRKAAQPYEGDLLQLAAYCLLVEETYGVTPPYGLLVYGERTFQIPFERGMRERLLDILDEMAAAWEDGEEVHRDHDEPARCARCSMREECGEEGG